MIDDLDRNRDMNIQHENQLIDEIFCVINRSVDEYAFSNVQLLGILEIIKLRYTMGSRVEEDDETEDLLGKTI